MNIIAKVGQRDNVVTYEHICDTRADMSKIEPRYVTLGSTCIVLQGESGMEVYMADSTHEWHDLLVSGGSNSGTPSGLSIHICGSEEVEDGMPNVLAPLETELYLVPAREESGNLYDEYVYVDGEWELFGGAPVNLSGYATQEWVSQQGYLTSHQSIPVQDVQVDGTSVVNNGVANIPIAASNKLGTVKVNGSSAHGIFILSGSGTDGIIGVAAASENAVKTGTEIYKPVVPHRQHAAAFYGLAKAAGDTTQAQSNNNVGTYTDSAKSAIQQMLGIDAAIATAIGDIHSFDVQVVQALPVENIEDHTIYFVSKQGASNDVYDEYLYINNAWELIGNTQIDLTGYATQTYVNDALAAADTLPTPDENGTALVSVNGEWIQQPNYGYSVTEDSFVLGNFTSSDFTQEDTEYMATIPLTDDLFTLLQRMFVDQEEFNIKINDTVYNSITDNFVYDTTTNPVIYLRNSTGNYDIFRLSPGYSTVVFHTHELPTVAKIYGSITTYTTIDKNLLPNINVEAGTGDLSVVMNGSAYNTASGESSVAQGYGTLAFGVRSHAEGQQTSANGTASHAEGVSTVAIGTAQHVQGRFNIRDNTYAHIVGNGENDDNRSNAHTLDWNGNAWYAGKVTAGTVASPANPTAANDLTTKQYVDNALAAKVVSVEGTTPAITAVADTQYICGEVSTLSFTPSATGTCDVIFQSGATATTLTIPNTVKFPEWFDASALEANMTYEINITNGTYGAVMAWPAT